MPGLAAVSAEQIRTTVLAMLAEAEMDPDHPPPTSDRFRKVVSVRDLRAGLAQVALPGLPDSIAEQMRTLWHAAVAVQLDEVVELKADATQAAEASNTAHRDADLRTEMLRIELADLRAECRSLKERAVTCQTTLPS